MGNIKKFASWLSDGKGSSKEGQSSTIIKLKLLNKRMARKVAKMDAQAKIFKAKAIKSREAGNMEASKTYMKNSLQYTKWSLATENFRVKLQNVQYRLEQAKDMRDFTSMAMDVGKVLAGLQKDVNEEEIRNMLGEMDKSFEGLDIAMEMTNDSLEKMDAGSSTAVSELELEKALDEIDAEISIKRGTDLPAAPMANTDSTIGSLEEELQKLKQQRP